jgi:uncharacterized membrane protein
MQSRLQSLIETGTSIAVGFGLALALQIFLARHDGVQMTFGQNFRWTLWFTLLSLVRGYALRRFFNWLHSRKAQ